MNILPLIPPKEIEIKLLCKFFHPLETTGKDGFYKCLISYHGKSSNETSFGDCNLHLLSTSSSCTISAMIKTEALFNTSEIIFNAAIIRCMDKSCSVKTKGISLDILSKTKLRIQLRNLESLIWMRSFYNEEHKIGIIVGLPRHTLDKELIVELPFKLISHKKILSVAIQLKMTSGVEIDTIEYSKYFRPSADDKTVHEETPELILNVELESTEKLLKEPLKSPEDLFSLRFFLKKIPPAYLQVSAVIEEVVFSDNRDMEVKPGINCTNNTVNIHLNSAESLYFIPVVGRELYGSNLAMHKEPYYLQNDSIKIFFLYGSKLIDITDKLECRPFDSSILRCPKNLKQNPNPISNFIYNKDIFQWSLELKSKDVQMVLDMKPQIITGDSWDISISDYVFNKIDGWRGPPRRSGTALLSDTRCDFLYQIIPIKVYRNVTLYNQDTQNKMNLMVDVTSRIPLKNIAVSPNYANIFIYGNTLIMQGLREGNIVIQLKDNNEKILSSKDLKVISTTVSIQDLVVSCISAINVSSSSSRFSFFTNVYDLKFDFKKFHKSQKCFLVVDLIYSDGSIANILTFPMAQFTIRFITNTKIIKVNDLQDMFYNYTTFNGETGFQVEIQESKICNHPRTIIKKFINLDPDSTQTDIPPPVLNTSLTERIRTTTSQENITTNVVYEMNFSTFHKVVYSLCAILAFILAGVIIKLLKDFIVKKKLRNRVERRRNSIRNNNNDLHEKLPLDKDYPPLLPSPGPQVGMTDNLAVALSSPQSFWCINPNNTLSHKKPQPFSRQYSLPIKNSPVKDANNYVMPCPPLRWINKLVAEDSKMNVYTSQEILDNCPENMPGSQMCWSVTQMEGDHSSGIGSLMTNMDDFIKDPYEARDRFSRLSEFPSMLNDKKETVYEPI